MSLRGVALVETSVETMPDEAISTEQYNQTKQRNYLF